MNQETHLKFIVSTDSSRFNEFLPKVKYKDIFQSPNWIKVAQNRGWGQEFFLLLENTNTQEILVAAIAHELTSKYFGTYLFIEHGPLLNSQLLKELPGSLASNWGELLFNSADSNEIVKEFITKLKEFCHQKNYFTVVIEPLATNSSDFNNILIKNHSIAQSKLNLPIYPMFVDLTLPEEELLVNISKNTRYYVKYAAKQGVEIEFHYPTDNEYEKTLSLMSEIYPLFLKWAQFKGQKIMPESFFLEAIKQNKGTNNIFITLAKHQSQIVSVNFSQRFYDWAGTYYTENSREFSQLRASYLLKWATMMEAKKQGAKVFDLWGQSINITADHKDYGFSQFKLGFKPFEKQFIGRIAIPINYSKFYYWNIFSKLQKKFSFFLR